MHRGHCGEGYAGGFRRGNSLLGRGGGRKGVSNLLLPSTGPNKLSSAELSAERMPYFIFIVFIIMVLHGAVMGKGQIDA